MVRILIIPIGSVLVILAIARKSLKARVDIPLERRPGELWVIAGFAFKKGWQEPVRLSLKIDKEAFLNEAKKGS